MSQSQSKDLVGRGWSDRLTRWRTPREAPPPLCRPRVPLRRARVALVTTAGVRMLDQQPFRRRAGDVTYRVIPAEARAADLLPDHPRLDVEAAAVDVNCVFPLDRLREFVAEGVVGAVAASHYGLMGYVPDPGPLRRVVGPEIGMALQRAGVDAVVLTAGCYVSHRSAAVIQRAIEAARIPTVLIAHYVDIVRLVRPPRALFVPFPPGRSLGPPGDRNTQRRVLYAALELLNAQPGQSGVEARYRPADAAPQAPPRAHARSGTQGEVR